MRHLTTRLILGAALLAQAAGCGGCRGKQGPADPASFLPPETPFAAEIHDLRKLGAAVAAAQGTKLSGLLASASGASTSEELVGSVVRQLGFDPRTPEGFKQAGLSGTLAAGQDGAAQLLVLGTADRGKAEAWVVGVASRAGAPRRSSEKQGGVEVVSFSAEAGPPLLAYAVAGGDLLIARGQDAAAAVARAAARTAKTSLAGAPAFAAAREKLGKRDILLYSARDPMPGALGISLDSAGLSLRALLHESPAMMSALKAAAQPAGGDLLARLPPGDFLAIRLGGDPAALAPFLERVLPPHVGDRLKQAGIDLSKDVLEKLRPGVVIGVGLAGDLDLSSGLPTGDRLDVNRTNPFSFVDLAVHARVKDPAAAGAVMDKLAASSGSLGFTVTSRTDAGRKIYASHYVAGEGLTWGLVGDSFVATGGKNAFAPAVLRVAAADPPFAVPESRARAVLDRSASALYLDVPRLAAALRGVPESSYGVGGFRIKQVVESWTSMLDEVRGVAAGASLDDDGLVIDVELGLK